MPEEPAFLILVIPLFVNSASFPITIPPAELFSRYKVPLLFFTEPLILIPCSDFTIVFPFEFETFPSILTPPEPTLSI